MGAAQRWGHLATSVLLLACFAGSVQASPEGRLPRVGFCSWAVPEADLASLSHPIPKTLAEGLRERGWEPGKNVELVFRSALGRRGGMAECIDVLVGSAVDVAVLVGPESVRLMRERTASIPIVTNHVAVGPRDSHSRPKDNVTGVTGTPGSSLKVLQLLKEIAPNINRVVMLEARREPADAATYAAEKMRGVPAWYSEGARALGLEIAPVAISPLDSLDQIFAALTSNGRTAVYLGNSATYVEFPSFAVAVQRSLLRHRLPAMGEESQSARVPGILIGYGASFGAMLKRLPYFVDRILRGAKPADLPIEQISSIELAINLDTAREIRLVVPPALLMRADWVVDGGIARRR